MDVGPHGGVPGLAPPSRWIQVRSEEAMASIGATSTALAVLGYVAGIACAMLLFLVSTVRYLEDAPRRCGGLALTFSVALLILVIGGGMVSLRFLPA